jgi:GTP cyclohydrolase FolE2
MNTVANVDLPDVQTDTDARGIALEAVGITGLRYPITVVLPDGTRQQTICSADLSVPLDAATRGTHMSRFVEALHEYRDAMSPAGVLALARSVSERLDGRGSSVDLRFPLFVERAAPVTDEPALLTIDCALGVKIARDGTTTVRVGLRAPVTALCPCSKEIADYSAHSQRGYLAISAVDSAWAIGGSGLWPHELLAICDQAGSAPIYPLLKRTDERHVTMLAYDRPAFVEDLARDVALALQGDARVLAYTVEAVNQESIHDHQAVARVSWRRA